MGVNNYDDMVIPEMEFTSNDRMVAFGDTKAVIFEGAQKPQAIAEIPMDEKTKSIFYNEHYIGIVTGNEDEAVTNHLAVYDENGILCAINRVPLETTGNTSVSVDKNDNAKKAKVFVFSSTLQPIITSEEFPLI